MTTNDIGLEIYCDGGSRGNPGPAASAFIVFKNSQVVHEAGFFLGPATNNQAEYTAVIRALEWLSSPSPLTSSVTHIKFYLDSLLVVSQLRGQYKIKNQNLLQHTNHIKQLIHALPRFQFSFNHIPRSLNSRADFLVNQTLDSHT